MPPCAKLAAGLHPHADDLTIAVADPELRMQLDARYGHISAQTAANGSISRRVRCLTSAGPGNPARRGETGIWPGS